VTQQSRARFAEAARAEPADVGLACLLVGAEVEPDLQVDDSLAVLDRLAASCRVRPGAGPAATARALRVALGDRAGFAGRPDDYDDLRSSLLHEVLRRGRGLPILLTVVWLEVARRLDLPAYAVALPGHVVAGFGDPEDEHVLADPFDGGRLLAPTDPSHPPPLLGHVDLLTRVLTNIRVLTTRQSPSLDAARTRLWAVELSLLLPRHAASLRRERGELLVRLGDHLAGAAVLEEHAELVEPYEPDVAEQCRGEARQARARLN